MYFKKLIGSKCYLSPVNVNDAEKFAEWLNDQEVVDYLQNSAYVVTMDSQRKSIEQTSNEHQYAIVDLESNKLIGKTALLDVDHISQRAKIDIFIGDKDYWNKGYGREALNLLLDYAFRILNLNNVMMSTYSFNNRAISCFGKVGFKHAGLLRNAIKRNLEYHNIVFMDILPEDFYQN